MYFVVYITPENFFHSMPGLRIAGWVLWGGIDRMDLCAKQKEAYECVSDIELQCRWCEKSEVLPTTGCYSTDSLIAEYIDPDSCD